MPQPLTLLLILGLWATSFTAFAACANPTANTGSVAYNKGKHVMMFCDGTNWINLAPGNPAGSSGNCTNPAGPEGSFTYNSGKNIMMFCNGTTWINMGKSNPGAGGSCTSPTGSPGQINFNSSNKRLQYCNGSGWVNAGNWVAASPPACNGTYTWTDQTAAGSRSWRDITSSSDGSKLAAAVGSGYI
jgi:hypothetical protein